VDEYDRQVPTGTPGEIVVRGPLVFQGYFDQPDVTAHTFRNGWHHTGDVGRFEADGYLHYVRRKPEKELIKPGGEKRLPGGGRDRHRADARGHRGLRATASRTHAGARR